MMMLLAAKAVNVTTTSNHGRTRRSFSDASPVWSRAVSTTSVAGAPPIQRRIAK